MPPGPSAEAGLDAKASADADAGSFVCPPDALFCDDFESMPAGSKWDRRYDDDKVLTSEEGAFGQGLGAKVVAHDGQQELSAFLEQPIDLGARKPFTVSFDLNVSKVSNIGILDIDFFRFHGPFLSFGLRIADYGGGAFAHWYGDGLDGGSALYTEKAMEPPPENQWTRVACSVSYPERQVGVRVTYDGRVVFDEKVPIDAYASEEPYLVAGFEKTVHAGPEVTVRFDNLLITAP